MNAESQENAIEVIRRDFCRGRFRAALFDFDGTLSLLRRNWQDVMIPMMVEHLQSTGTTETAEQLYRFVEDFVMELNGRQTIYQMMRLAEEMVRRGGAAVEPLVYKHQYHERLWVEVRERIAAIREGRWTAEAMTVPGARELLEALRQRGLRLYLASGTDVHYVRDELAVLGLDDYFGEHVYGALDDYRRFSKATIIRQILEELRLEGAELLGFGDGFVEMEEVRRAGGVAVGVASDEVTREGISLWKRRRLCRAGADLIIPH